MVSVGFDTGLVQSTRTNIFLSETLSTGERIVIAKNKNRENMMTVGMPLIFTDSNQPYVITYRYNNRVLTTELTELDYNIAMISSRRVILHDRIYLKRKKGLLTIGII